MSDNIITRSGKSFGGKFCEEELPPQLLPADGHELTADERGRLWRLFQEIGRCWENVRRDSLNLKSSWLEFLEAKTNSPPSYAAEYASAVKVLEELVLLHGEEDAYSRLFLDYLPDKEPRHRLAHAKLYVVDEFISMQVVASGFRGFGGRNHAKNYNGFIRGSRYNRNERVRSFRPGDAPP